MGLWQWWLSAFLRNQVLNFIVSKAQTRPNGVNLYNISRDCLGGCINLWVFLHIFKMCSIVTFINFNSNPVCLLSMFLCILLVFHQGTHYQRHDYHSSHHHIWMHLLACCLCFFVSACGSEFISHTGLVQLWHLFPIYLYICSSFISFAISKFVDCL